MQCAMLRPAVSCVSEKDCQKNLPVPPMKWPATHPESIGMPRTTKCSNNLDMRLQNHWEGMLPLKVPNIKLRVVEEKVHSSECPFQVDKCSNYVVWQRPKIAQCSIITMRKKQTCRFSHLNGRSGQNSGSEREGTRGIYLEDPLACGKN